MTGIAFKPGKVDKTGPKNALTLAKINCWKNFYESINKIPELTRLRKIFAKDRGAIMET